MIVNQQKNITDIFKEVSYDDLKQALESWLNPEGEGANEGPNDLPWETNNSNTSTESPKKEEATAQKASTTDDISKAFDDLFN